MKGPGRSTRRAAHFDLEVLGHSFGSLAPLLAHLFGANTTLNLTNQKLGGSAYCRRHLDECVQELLAKPKSTPHLYNIYTEPQPPLVSDLLAGDQICRTGQVYNGAGVALEYFHDQDAAGFALWR